MLRVTRNRETIVVSLPLSRGAWNTGAREVGEDMPRKPLDIRLHCLSLSGVAKTAESWLLPPARAGLGRAQRRYYNTSQSSIAPRAEGGGAQRKLRHIRKNHFVCRLFFMKIK